MITVKWLVAAVAIFILFQFLLPDFLFGFEASLILMIVFGVCAFLGIGDNKDAPV